MRTRFDWTRKWRLHDDVVVTPYYAPVNGCAKSTIAHKISHNPMAMMLFGALHIAPSKLVA